MRARGAAGGRPAAGERDGRERDGRERDGREPDRREPDGRERDGRERSGASPETGLRGAGRVIRATLQHLSEHRVGMVAGSLAYNWFLSLFPAVIAALGVLGLVGLGPSGLRHLTHGLTQALPPGSAGVFTAAVDAAARNRSGSLAAVVVGVVSALWSASGGMSTLEEALDVAYDLPDDRGYVSARLHAVPLLAATAVLGGAAAAVVVFGEPLGSAIEAALPVRGAVFDASWTVLRFALAAVLVSILFSAYYALGPNRRATSWTWLSAGAVVAGAVFLAASLGFSFFVTRFGSYGATYGSFAGVAILVLWLYLVGFAVLAGAELNAEIERRATARRGGRRAEPDSGPGERAGDAASRTAS